MFAKKDTAIMPSFTAKPYNEVTLRSAHVDEVTEIARLFEAEVRAGRMLPRNTSEMAQHIENWIVAESNGAVVGCVSLVPYNPYLCELRSLAVSPDHQHRGIGSLLVGALVELAAARGYVQVLTLTRASALFEKKGFMVDSIDNFPEKARRDCAPCPFKSACDEVALVFAIH